MVFDKFISKILDNEKNTYSKVYVDEEVIDSVVFYSKKSYPNEFLAMFDGYIENNALFITSLIFLPGERSHTGASFNDWLLPPDQKKFGTVHSHPGYNSAYPSNADLVTFSKQGSFHIILCEPYSLETMNAYDAQGTPISFEVGNFKRDNQDLMLEDLEEIQRELEAEYYSKSENIFTRIDKAFSDDDDDFYDSLDDDFEKINKYAHEFEDFDIDLVNNQSENLSKDLSFNQVANKHLDANNFNKKDEEPIENNENSTIFRINGERISGQDPNLNIVIEIPKDGSSPNIRLVNKKDRKDKK